MTHFRTRRSSPGGARASRVIGRTALGAFAALALAISQLAAASYEVWALDQGTNTIYVITADLVVGEVIELPASIDMPHMISFDSQFRYAFVANPASANTAVIRTADRAVVAVLPTGAGSHYAGVVPGDERAIVDVIGDAKLVEITLDLAAETFTIGRELVIADDPAFVARAEEFAGSSPVCHETTADGRYAYVTLGPALAAGGLVILDTEAFALAHVFPPDEVASNCGAGRSPDGSHMMVNGGSLEEGRWYVFDAATHQLVHQGSSHGTDAHGAAFTPDGAELWMVNRHSSNGIVIDAQTFEVTDELPFTVSSPDILAISPDGRRAFITLRGPEPRSGPHAIAGETPGVAVMDVATRALVTILEPDPGNPRSDFHGIGIRPLEP
jgi:hypothetical protein